MRLGLSHLNEHRFNHNFQSCINPLCSCSLAIESTTHFLLHYHHFSYIRSTLSNSINEVLGSIANASDLSVCAWVKILLFADQNYTQVENTYVIIATTKYYPSAYDKLLGSNFCISQVLSVYFPCFNSGIANVC